jgi:hypothetical protein
MKNEFEGRAISFETYELYCKKYNIFEKNKTFKNMQDDIYYYEKKNIKNIKKWFIF